MRNSLLLKLLGAFLLVILIGGMVISISIGLSTRSAFSLYTTRVGQTWAEALSVPLAEYYLVANRWDGVAAFINTQLPLTTTMMGNYGSGVQGHGMMGQGPGKPTAGQRIILADTTGKVIFDSTNLLSGQLLTSKQIVNGVPIYAADQHVGTLIVAQQASSPLTAAAETFLASVNRSILIAALVASLIAILLGVLMFQHITSPLQTMKSVAAELAQGNLDRRIPIKTKDELGDLATAINNMAGDLQNAQTQRRHMIADIAHELRTPLTVIQANLEGMLDGVIPSDDKHLAILHEESLLLNRLIADLRLLSVAEAGELILEKQPVDLSRFLPGLLDKFKPAAIEKKIQLEYKQESPLPEISIDSDRISQVINNLIANALNYTPQKGRITLIASVIDEGIKVSVCDNGPGIPVNDLSLIFERFYRVDKSRARKSGGSGLGLAIAKQLVEEHGGTVAAVSPANDNLDHPGTCISFTLPSNP